MRHRTRLRTANQGTFFGLVMGALLVSHALAASPRPNIVLIFADDK